MEKIKLDSGVESFRIGAGVLRFNPTDPNLYARFLEAVDSIAALESQMGNPQVQGAEAVALLGEIDSRVKAILQQVFGPENDLAGIFAGVNLLALGTNGKRVLNNFFDALEPIMTRGAKACAAQRAQKL